jgi:hypothetical protein
MSLYTELAATIRAAFQGDLDARDVTFRRYTNVSSLVQGTTNRALAASVTLPGLVLPASGGTLEAFDVRFMQDVQDAANVRFAIFAADGASFRPGPKDVADLYGDGREWLVMGNTPLNVDGNTDLLYSVGFRLP